MKRAEYRFPTLVFATMLFLLPSLSEALPVGDITCDDAVNVLDVVALVNGVLSGEALEACDNAVTPCDYSLPGHCEELLTASPEFYAFYGTDQEMAYGVEGCIAYCDGNPQGVSDAMAQLDYGSEVEAAEDACMGFCYEALGLFGMAPLSSLEACWESCVDDQSGEAWSCSEGF